MRQGHRVRQPGGFGGPGFGPGHPFFGHGQRWQPPPPPPRIDSATATLNPHNFEATVFRGYKGKASWGSDAGGSEGWLVQIYYDYSEACRHFAPSWEALAKVRGMDCCSRIAALRGSPPPLFWWAFASNLSCRRLRRTCLA